MQEEYSPEEKGSYAKELSFDPTQSKYFDMFMDVSKRPASDHGKPDDMSLSPTQVAAFKQNGYVLVCEFVLSTYFTTLL